MTRRGSGAVAEPSAEEKTVEGYWLQGASLSDMATRTGLDPRAVRRLLAAIRLRWTGGRARERGAGPRLSNKTRRGGTHDQDKRRIAGGAR